MQRHVVRLAEARERVGGVTGLATRALVVTALVGGTGAYLHAGTSTNGDATHDGAQRFAAAGLHEAAGSEGPQTLSTVHTLGTAPATVPEPPAADVGPSKSLRPTVLVNVYHDGDCTPVITTARTVTGALAQGEIVVGPHDLVQPGRSMSPRAGMGIHVVRVRFRVEHSNLKVGYDVIRKPDAHMTRGQSKVVRHGRTGVTRVTYRVVLHDSKFDHRVVTKRTVVRAAVSQVVHYGTKKAASTSRAHRSVDGLNWHALARCESGNNPRAVGGGGRYFGLYQFSIGTWHSVGGSGKPTDASPAEQTKRAKLLYQRRGSAPWPVCGREASTRDREPLCTARGIRCPHPR